MLGARRPGGAPAEAERTRCALQPWLVVSDRAFVPGMHVNPVTGLPANPVTRIRAAAPPQQRTGSVALHTSGSTGTPKTVVLTEHQLLHVARCVVSHHKLSATDRGFNPLPLFHINA